MMELKQRDVEALCEGVDDVDAEIRRLERQNHRVRRMDEDVLQKTITI